MTYATVDDVAVLLLRSLTSAETNKAAVLLPVADAKINRAVPSVPARVIADASFAELVKYVAASLVQRALTGAGEGVTSTEEAIDDYRRVERRETPSEEGGFDLTEGEIELLQELADGDASTGGAFTIKPYSTLRIPRQRRPMDCP